MAVITISRQFGSGGELIARMVCQKTGYMLVNKETINEKLRQYGFSEEDLSLFDEKRIKSISREMDEDLQLKSRQYFETLHNLIFDLAIRENLVILGRGGQVLFKDFPPALHVKIISPLNSRIARVKKLYSLDEAGAARLISEQDEERQEYLQSVFGCDWLDLDFYHVVVNTGKIPLEEAALLTVRSAELQESTSTLSVEELESVQDLEEQLPSKESASQPQDAKGGLPSFAHSSEEEFARVLDFYQIKWLYEPKTFPLQWDSEGNVTEAFSPDFYLPEQDLYVEITTQKQKLVWRKNKKARRLKELYPDVNIKIIYGRDYKALLQKYGIDEELES